MSDTLPKTQKAYVYKAYGASADVMQLTEVPVPAVGPHDVLVRVAYTGINPIDWKIRAGYVASMFPQTLPSVPGWDLSGTVVAAGASTSFKAGEAVYALNRPAFQLAAAHPESNGEVIGLNDGTAQQYVAVKAWKLAKAPKKATLAQAGSIPTAGITSHEALHDHGGLKSGQTVLITGASGGVGGFGVGVAKAAGARVIATCSTKNVDYVKKLGADEVIDYTKGALAEQLKGQKVDLVFDCVGGETTLQAIKALKDDGVIVSIASFDVSETAKKEGKVGKSFAASPSGERLAKIAQLVDDGKVVLPRVVEFPWEKLRESHDESQTGRTVGKIVVKVD